VLTEYRVHLHVYGLKNCDSCRNTLRWLEARNVPCTFHDIRADGLDRQLLSDWLDTAHRDYLVNRRSTTWRSLTDEQKQQAAENPLPLLLEHPTLLKRPVITDGETLLDIGFDPQSLEDYI
jgi:Spx/MgsR family transcriptional regulator